MAWVGHLFDLGRAKTVLYSFTPSMLSSAQNFQCLSEIQMPDSPGVLIPNTILELLANYCNSWSLHLLNIAPSKARYALPEAVTTGYLLTQILPTFLWRKCLYGTPMGGYGYLYLWALFDSEPVTDRILSMLLIFPNVYLTRSP